MDDVRKPLLDNHDKHTPTWQKIQKHLTERLESLRTMNEKNHDKRKTAELRGRIKELRSLLTMDSDTPIVDESEMFKD